MGAKIEGAGSDTIRIQGVDRLVGCELRRHAGPDRERHLSRCAAAITGGRVRLTHTAPEHFDAVLQKLEEAGARIERGADWIELDMRGDARARWTSRPRRTRAFRPTCRRSSAR